MAHARFSQNSKTENLKSSEFIVASIFFAFVERDGAAAMVVSLVERH